MANQCTANSAYSPIAAVTAFHNIPHIDINLDPVDPTFKISLDYFQPIIIWACVPVLACVCLFILLSVYYICICCCCCCRDKKSRPKAVKIACAFFVSLVILFCCGLIGGLLYAEVELDRYLQMFVTNVRNIGQTLDDVSTQLETYPSGQVASSLDTINGAIMRSNANPDEMTAAESNIDLLRMANVLIHDGINSVNDSLNSVDYEPILDGLSMFELIRHWTVIGFLIFVAILLILLFLVTICLSPIGLVIFMVFIGIATMAVWVAFGGSLAAVIVTADLCVDPDGLVRNNTGAPEIVNYYVTCNSNCPTPFSSFMEISDELDGLQSNLSDLRAFLMMYTSQQLGNLNSVQDGFNVARDIALNASTTLMCSTSRGIHEEYQMALANFCNSGFIYSLVLFSLAGGLGLSLLFLICCTTAFAGLLASTRREELDREDFLALETEHTIAWSNRRGSYTEPYNSSTANGSSYRQREEYPMQEAGTLGVVEPPKYSDLGASRQPGRPQSGEYDHFDA